MPTSPPAQSSKRRLCRCERPARASENGVDFCALCGRKLRAQRPPSNGAQLAEVKRSLAEVRATLTGLLRREAKASDSDRLLSMKQVAARLRISYDTVRRGREHYGFPPKASNGHRPRTFATPERVEAIERGEVPLFPPRGWRE